MLSRLKSVIVAVAVLATASPIFAAGAENGAKTGHAKTGKSAGAHHEHIGAKDADERPEEFKVDLAIYTFVVFLLLMGILWKFAWGPISAGLDARETKIAEDIATAEQGRRTIEQMLAEHQAKLDTAQDEVREILAEARRDAEHVKQEIMASAQSEAEALKERSIAEIGRAKDAALGELFETMSGQIAEATEYVVGRSMTGDDQDRLIQEAMSQFPR